MGLFLPEIAEEPRDGPISARNRRGASGWAYISAGNRRGAPELMADMLPCYRKCAPGYRVLLTSIVCLFIYYEYITEITIC